MSAIPVKCDTQECPINGSVNLKFHSDANDQFFNQDLGNGELTYSHDLISRQNFDKGELSLTITPERGFNSLFVGQTINYRLNIKDNGRIKFIFEIPIKITEAQLKKSKSKKKKRKKRNPRTYTRVQKFDKNSKNKRSFADTPIIIPLSKQKNPQKWKEKFGDSVRRGAHVEISNDGRVRFHVNTSHPNLIQYQELHEEYRSKKKTQELIEKYCNLIAFNSWSFYLLHEKKAIEYPDDEKHEDIDVEKTMMRIADSIAYFGLSFLEQNK